MYIHHSLEEEKGGLPIRDTTSRTEKVRSRCGTGAKTVKKVVSRLGTRPRRLKKFAPDVGRGKNDQKGGLPTWRALKNARQSPAGIF